MSELHTEDTESVDLPTEAVETGTGETGAELAPASEGNHEEKPEGFNQEAANKAINKKHYLMKEAERKAQAAEDKARELEEKLASIERGSEPVVPPIPDPFDDDYEAKVKARDEAILKKASFDAQENMRAEMEQSKIKKAQEAEQEKTQKLLSNYAENTKRLGLDQAEIDQASDVLVNSGISSDLAAFLLEDAEGPLIAKHLAANPLERDELLGMSPMQAAIHIEKVVRNKASALKPKVTGAPDPVDTLSGAGALDDSRPNIKGATFS